VGKQKKYVFSKRTETILKTLLFLFCFVIFVLPWLLIVVAGELLTSREVVQTISWPNSNFVMEVERSFHAPDSYFTNNLYLKDKRDFLGLRKNIFDAYRYPGLYACINGKDIAIASSTKEVFFIADYWLNGSGETNEERCVKIRLIQGPPPEAPYKCVAIK